MIRRNTAFVHLILLGFLGTVHLSQAADQEALRILQKASQFPSKPYRGAIVSKIQHGTKKQQVRATVQMESSQHYKKEYFAPDGKLDKIIFANQQEEWIYFPSKKMVWKGDLKKSQSKLLSENKEWELIAENYDLNLKPGENIAGRNTWVLDVKPKAKGKPYRTLWIDQDQYLILKSREYNPDGTLTIESAFEKIDFPAGLDAGAFNFRVPAGTHVQDHEFSPDFLSLEELKESGAHFPRMPEHLPAGFVFESADFFNVKSKEVSHLRYTDGLNVISLFESAYPVSTKTGAFQWEPSEFETATIGFSRAGKILYWQSGNRYFTLVGNLSSEALHKIAKSIK
ncbi:MAG: outer membrane lipoprotein-sorting protein [Elusimicrobia bacterium]|nr:outer membrane lipoprotein-sorting protein [Candidatus Obscuribacterium magneticum]